MRFTATEDIALSALLLQPHSSRLCRQTAQPYSFLYSNSSLSIGNPPASVAGLKLNFLKVSAYNLPNEPGVTAQRTSYRIIHPVDERNYVLFDHRSPSLELILDLSYRTTHFKVMPAHQWFYKCKASECSATLETLEIFLYPRCYHWSHQH